VGMPLRAPRCLWCDASQLWLRRVSTFRLFVESRLARRRLGVADAAVQGWLGSRTPLPELF